MSKVKTLNDVDYLVHFAAGAYGGQGSVALEVKTGDGNSTLARMDVRANGKIINAVTHQNLVEEHQKILWSGEMYMQAGQTATLSENITAQNNGIVLVWSAYSNGAAGNYNWNFKFVPKQMISSYGSGNGTVCRMSGTNFSAMGCKYVYVNNGSIAGNDVNKASGTGSGITYNNTQYVLRYVIGV